jgi:GNAT superfamily N-acetyltransferase
MDKINIHLANESDALALYNLYLEFHEFHAKHLPAYLHSLGTPSNQEREIFLSRIKTVIQGKDSAILIAESSGTPIGLAEIRLNPPEAESHGIVPIIYAHLQSLAVTERFKRQGVGGQLLQAAQTWAQAHKAVELRLDIWEFSAGPLAYYEKLGYKTIRRTLAKNLSAPHPNDQ